MLEDNTARILLYILLIVDGVTTYVVINFYGAKEANPIMKFIMDRIGTISALVLSRLVGLYFIVFNMYTGNNVSIALWVLVVVFLFASVNNCYQIFKSS